MLLVLPGLSFFWFFVKFGPFLVLLEDQIDGFGALHWPLNGLRFLQQVIVGDSGVQL